MKADKDVFTQHLLNMPLVCWYSVSWDTKWKLMWSASQVGPCPVMETRVDHPDAGTLVSAWGSFREPSEEGASNQGLAFEEV